MPAQARVGELLTARQAMIRNDVGGTTTLPEGAYPFAVSRSWHDPETGIRYQGRLTQPEDVEIARQVGTTGHTPEDYKKYAKINSALYTGAVAAFANFDPSVVYVSEHELIG